MSYSRGILLPILPVYLDCLDFCEGIFIKDFVIPSQGGTQEALLCLTRGDFAANTTSIFRLSYEQLFL